ncbi:MAG: hypothetical protein KDL87_19380 [Verrucomicrobiae bacterium]|nr:hypothetical protein [Verrucomicrobiae bacterium]
MLIANLMSFILGSLALNFFTIPKESLFGTALIWFGAFLISWVAETLVFRFRLDVASNIEVWRATFWGNVASYTIAAGIFLAYLRGGTIPGLLIR